MRNPITEQFLRKYGFKFEYIEKIPLSEIDLKSSLENPARLGKKIELERVERYKNAMEEGTKFPAVVLIKNKDGSIYTYNVATGNHRLCGLEGTSSKVAKETDAYVVYEVDPYRIDLLIKHLNSIEGKAPSEEDTMRHAVDMKNTHPDQSTEDIARDFGIAVSSFRFELRVENLVKRAQELGINNIEKSGIPKDTLENLNQIKQRPVLREAIIFVQTSRPPTNKVKELVAEIKRHGSERSQIAHILRFKENYDEQKKAQGINNPGQPPQSSNKRIIARLKALETTLRRESIYPGSITALEKDDVIERMEWVSETLLKLKDILVSSKI